MQLIYSLAICAVVVGGTSAYARDYEEENCTTSGQVKTCCAETFDRKICEVTSGQTKTITVSIPKFEPPAKLCPNYPPILCDISIVFEKVTTNSDELISWRLVFDDIQHDKALVRLMIDSQMEEHIPLSTRDQRAKLLDQLLIAANKSPVRAYGYTWSLTSTGTPMKTLTLEAVVAK